MLTPTFTATPSHQTKVLPLIFLCNFMFQTRGAPSPITSWQMEGEQVEAVTDFIFLGSKTTVDGACSHEIKQCLLLGRKAMTNLNNVLKSRDIILLTNVHVFKIMTFPVVRYECESSTIRKVERWKIDAFKLAVGEDSWKSLGLQGDQTSPS